MARLPILPILEGRRFGCTRCGHCCLEPGYVFMTFEEMKAMAEYLGMAVAVFKARFKISWDGDTKKWMIDANPSGCPLLTVDRGCSVHPVKPMQCQTFPFWTELIDDETAWSEAKTYCPGMDAAGGRLYSAEEIRAISEERRGT